MTQCQLSEYSNIKGQVTMIYCEVNVGERIRYFRNLRGWSQETLALQAEINPAFLWHLERGLKSPTIKTPEKIVRNALAIEE